MMRFLKFLFNDIGIVKCYKRCLVSIFRHSKSLVKSFVYLFATIIVSPFYPLIVAYLAVNGYYGKDCEVYEDKNS